MQPHTMEIKILKSLSYSASLQLFSERLFSPPVFVIFSEENQSK